jgi:hypothetical protein
MVCRRTAYLAVASTLSMKVTTETLLMKKMMKRLLMMCHSGMLSGMKDGVNSLHMTFLAQSLKFF